MEKEFAGEQCTVQKAVKLWQYSTLCIFTAHGKTFTFKNVTIDMDNETVLVFTYRAMSDGKAKTGTFFKTNFVGYSVTP